MLVFRHFCVFSQVVGDRHNGNGSNGGGSGGSGGGSNGGGSGGSNSGPSLVGNIDDKSDAFESNEDYVISYINVNGKRVKSIASPEIIRQDQPNEVYIRLFKGIKHVLNGYMVNYLKF